MKVQLNGFCNNKPLGTLQQHHLRLFGFCNNITLGALGTCTLLTTLGIPSVATQKSNECKREHVKTLHTAEVAQLNEMLRRFLSNFLLEKLPRRCWCLYLSLESRTFWSSGSPPKKRLERFSLTFKLHFFRPR